MVFFVKDFFIFDEVEGDDFKDYSGLIKYFRWSKINVFFFILFESGLNLCWILVLDFNFK